MPRPRHACVAKPAGCEALETRSDQPFFTVSPRKRNFSLTAVYTVEPPTIPSNKLIIRLYAKKYDFGILTSSMHIAWLSHVGGRLESRFQYSGGVVYNTFPWPEISPAQEAKIAELAQAVLDARAAWPVSTLADLYDPDLMALNLRKAHQALDVAVDRLYRTAPFMSERERVEHLFGLYEKMVVPIEAAAKAKAKRKKPSAA
jgi:hypothetical protein